MLDVQELDGGSFEPDGDSFTFTVTPAGLYPLGDTQATLSVTDNHAASSSCTAIITIVDNTPPAITTPPPVIVTTGAGAKSCGVLVSDETLGTVGGTDACGSVTTSRSGVPVGNLFPVGTTVINYTVTDNSGNMTTSTQSVTVIDNTPPTITCPANIRMTLALGQISSPIIFGPTAGDNCSIAAVTCSPASGSNFQIGSADVVCASNDPTGNISSCAFNLTLVTPQEATRELINLVNDLANRGAVKNGPGNSLRAKLQNTIQKLDSGDQPGACQQLQNFINQVNNFISDGVLPLAEGEPLIFSAVSVKNAIDC